MGSIVKEMKTLPWVAVGLVLLLGPLQLGAAIEEKPGPRLEKKLGPQLEKKPGPPVTVQNEPQNVWIEIPGDVLFDFDKWDLRPDAEPTLQQVAGTIQETIQQFPNSKITIAGYTDAKGSDAYNLELSERRAKAVKAWLVQQGGVDGKRITTRGLGKAKPVAPNTHPDGSDNPEGRQKNRRVVLTVKK